MSSRRKFIRHSGTALVALQTGLTQHLFATSKKKEEFPLHQNNLFGATEVDAHLWVYASRYPPDWDCTPILDEVFSDLSYAGYSGVEIMEPILRHDDAVDRLKQLQEKHKIALAGTSYHGDMWNSQEHTKIAEDIDMVTDRLQQAGGKMIGLSVGDAGRKKTEKELDSQAQLLSTILKTCAKNNIEANIHNHTYEMEYDMADFKGTIERLPELKLGPDLNWLIRAKVDPVWFIKTYGDRIVYMHIRDQKADGKWTEAVGEGATNFADIAKALKSIGYNKKAAVELAFEGGFKPTRPLRESWKISRQYVQKVFGW
jgi:sugar phosphate isomerase/epimerase